MTHLLRQVYGEVHSELAPAASGRRRGARQGSEDVVGQHRRTSELAYRQDTVPRAVHVSVEPDEADEIAGWLSELRGSQVTVQRPQRGDKAQLLETVAENARQALTLHKSRRAGDLTTRSASLQQLQEALDLPDALMRIECYDISHVQGTNVVASMVVFEDGLPRKSEYRKFSITGDAARDDTASMYDVIHRRFSRHVEQQKRAAEKGVSTGRWTPRRRSPRPARSRTRPTWWWWTAALPRWPRRSVRWTTSASRTSTWWAWRSASRRSGSRTTSSP